MKKNILTIAFAVIGLFTVNAQEAGFKAGVNFASLSGDDSAELNSRTSFHVGFTIDFEISDRFAIQPELLYSNQGATFDAGRSEDVTIRLGYINVPILASYAVIPGLSLQAGPQVGFNISSDVEFDGETEDIDNLETVDLALALGAQYELEQGLFFQARYNLGLSNIEDDIDQKNGVFALSVGYKF